jgi:hypothetical protein
VNDASYAARGFPQMLQIPFSLIVPTQFPSLHNVRSDASAFSSSLLITVFPHWQQKRLPAGISAPHSAQDKTGNASPQ